MVGQTAADDGAQVLQGCGLVGAAVGDIGVNLGTHCAAFISNPSSILSEGTTG